MRTDTVLFDLGGTLAYYYMMSEFPDLLRRGIAGVQEYLLKEGKLAPSSIRAEEISRRVVEEDHESKNHRTRPLEDRLYRIFQLDASICSDEFEMEMCRCFMKPIFARGHCYDDTIPILKKLRSTGFKVGIVSNTSWGSPAILWREEISRLGLEPHIEASVFCRDVGWRKPARQIFEFALNKLNSKADQCVFVGDNPQWDTIGPKAVGISPILLTRGPTTGHANTIATLNDLLGILEFATNPS